MTTMIPPPAPPADTHGDPASQQFLTGALPPGGSRAGATVIVASDGSQGSDGAIRMALARVDAKHDVLEVLTVIPKRPSGTPVESMLRQEDDNTDRRQQRDAVEAQLARIAGTSRVHGVTVLDGSPADTISSIATERRAALVIVGLGRHDLAERLFGEETAGQLARISRVPVLAVPENAAAVASHAVVAVDFSEISDRAVQAAIDVVGDEGIVELVHVTPYVSESPLSSQGQEPYKRWAQSKLDALIGRLVVTPGVTLTRAVIRGHTAHALLEHTRLVGADLIAAGTHGRGYVMRAMLGSVTTDLLRGARCAVLMVPREPLSSSTAAERAPVVVASDPARVSLIPPRSDLA